MCYYPKCALIPLKGGSPVFVSARYPVGVRGDYRVVYLPCGHCLGCEIDKRRDYTVLQMCEASCYDDNWFLTLTYDPDHLPVNGSLSKDHFRKFTRALKDHFRVLGVDFRFFGCGEYGDNYERPHYHLSLFGLSADDLNLLHQDSVIRSVSLNSGNFKRSLFDHLDANGNFVFDSPLISRFWSFGSHKLYRANKDTFQYVAGYVTKKLSGAVKRRFEDSGKVAPFVRQSRPSIGRAWFDRYNSQLIKWYSDGKLHCDSFGLAIGDIKSRVPRIMLKWLARKYGLFFVQCLSDVFNVDMPDMPDFDLLRRKHTAAKYKQSQINYKERNKVK